MSGDSETVPSSVPPGTRHGRGVLPGGVAVRAIRTGPLPRFVAVGTAGTLLQLGLFVALASRVDAAVAGSVSWVVSTVITNAVQSKVTFRSPSRRGAAAGQVIAFLSCLVALSLATGVAVLLCQQPTPARLAALVAVNAVTGIGRFVLLRRWQQRSEARPGCPSPSGPAAVDGGRVAAAMPAT